MEDKTSTALAPKKRGSHSVVRATDPVDFDTNQQAIAIVNGVSEIAARHKGEGIDGREQAYEEYKALCQQLNARMGNMAAYAAIGICRANVMQIMQGTLYKSEPRYKALCEKIKSEMGMYREILANNNQVNVAWAIFSAKNYDGMRDQVDIAPVATSPLGEYKTSTEIAEEYADIIRD